MTEEYEQSIGTTISLVSDEGYIGDSVRVRRLGAAEQRVAQKVRQAEAKEKMKAALKQGPPSHVPHAAKAALVKEGMRNPTAFVKDVVKDTVARKVHAVANGAKAAMAAVDAKRAEKIASVVKEANDAVKAGLPPAQARQAMQMKTQEVMQAADKAKQAVVAEAKAQIQQEATKPAEAYAAVVQQRNNVIDAAQRKTDDEITKVAASKMPAAVKAVAVKTLQERRKNLQLAAGKNKMLNAKAAIQVMATKGSLSKKKANELSKNLDRKVKDVQTKQRGIVKKQLGTANMESKLFTLGKWIESYKSAIAQATQVNASYVTMPLGKNKTGKAQTEVKMALPDAKKKLEMMMAQYKALESQLAKLKPAKIPPAVMAVDKKTGSPVTPEQLKAQTDYIRAQIATGKVNPEAGAAALKSLQTVEKFLYKGGAKKGAPIFVIRLDISPNAMKYLRCGERMVQTAPGTGKTFAQMPKPAIPSAIPSTVVKTAPTPMSQMTPQVIAKPSPTIMPAQTPSQVVTTPTSRMVPGLAQRPGTPVPVKPNVAKARKFGVPVPLRTSLESDWMVNLIKKAKWS